ncbi:excalibur calcium-binding domain-containing protein [Streptomyces sp. NPDC092369]|uniref:excalibur calcium-binding domain-containing protein n=1 Tax=Streptomyces sp. NPDC092369 TaxID=3366015 RepID=UPI003809E496
MTNPYNTSPGFPPNPPAGIPPTGPGPRWARKRYVVPAIGFAFLVGLLAGGGDDGKEPASASAAPRVTATVTTTATATVTETADPEPAATVTVRATRTVKATVTARPAEVAGGSDGGDGGDDSTGQDVYYANCAAARAAGAAPVRVGDPGYGRHLDRDGDGVGCE